MDVSLPERERERDVHCKCIHPILNWMSWFSFNGIRFSFAVWKSQRCRETGAPVLLSTGPMGKWCCFINHTSLAVMMRNAVFKVSKTQIYEQQDRQSRGRVSANHWFVWSVETFFMFSLYFQFYEVKCSCCTPGFSIGIFCVVLSPFISISLLSRHAPRGGQSSPSATEQPPWSCRSRPAPASCCLRTSSAVCGPQSFTYDPVYVHVHVCVCVCKSLERSPNDAAYKAGRNEVKSPLTDLAADDKWMWPWQTLWKSGEVVVSGVGAASSAAHSSHPGIVHRHLKAKKTVSLQQRLLLCFTNVQLMNNTSFEYSQCISMETDFIPPKKKQQQ